MCVICILFFIIIFYRQMSLNLKYALYQVMAGIIALGILYAWLISVARAEGTDKDPLIGIYRYFGEPFLNLGHLFWGHVKAHPYGERLFDRITNPFPSDWTRHDIYMYWWSYTGVPNFNFKTIYGDFYIEFGWWEAIVIIVAIGMSFNYIFSHLKMTLATLPIFYFYLQICIFSFAGFTKHDMGFIYQLLFIFLYIKILPRIVSKRY